MRDRSTRLSTFPYTGTLRYSLTFCTAERMAWFHLLIEGRAASSDARQFIKLSKQLTEFAHRQRWHARLWKASAWDRVLRTEDDSWAVIRYILANPVRAGLVKEPLDYPFSGSIKHTREDWSTRSCASAGGREGRPVDLKVHRYGWHPVEPAIPSFRHSVIPSFS